MINLNIYEKFNRIATLDKFVYFIKSLDNKDLIELYRQIVSEHEMFSYEFSKKINEWTKAIAKESIENECNIAINRFQTNITFEESVMMAEAITAGFLDIECIEEDGCYKSENLISDYLNHISWNCFIEERELDINKYTVLILAKYIFNNITLLSLNVEERLISLYLLEEQKEIEQNIKKIVSELNVTIENIKYITNDIKPKIENSEENIIKIEPKLEKVEMDIKDINKNMVTIMAMFITAFSIIGTNIYSITNGLETNQIIVINSSLLFVLSFLMHLLDKIINNGNAKLGKISIELAVFSFLVILFQNGL